MKISKPLLLKLSGWTLLAVVTVLVAGDVYRLASQPDWVLAVKNGNRGMTVLVSTTARSADPVYTIAVKGETLEEDVKSLVSTTERSKYPDGVRLVSLDRTFSPGHWTVEVGSARIEIAPAEAVVNGRLKCKPGRSVDVAPKP